MISLILRLLEVENLEQEMSSLSLLRFDAFEVWKVLQPMSLASSLTMHFFLLPYSYTNYELTLALALTTARLEAEIELRQSLSL